MEREANDARFSGRETLSGPARAPHGPHKGPTRAPPGPHTPRGLLWKSMLLSGVTEPLNFKITLKVTTLTFGETFYCYSHQAGATRSVRSRVKGNYRFIKVNKTIKVFISVTTPAGGPWSRGPPRGPAGKATLLAEGTCSAACWRLGGPTETFRHAAVAQFSHHLQPQTSKAGRCSPATCSP